MNEEVNNHLKWNLEEAYSDFQGIIAEMKDNNVDIDYDEVEKDEKDYYQEVAVIMTKLDYYLNEVLELQDTIYNLRADEFKLYPKYLCLYIVSFIFIKLFHEIFDTRDLDDMVKYMVGMFLGSCYVGLLAWEVHDNRTDTKEKRDLINKYKTLKEEYKKTHDELVLKIDSMYDLNTRLWYKNDQEKVKNKQI